MLYYAHFHPLRVVHFIRSIHLSGEDDPIGDFGKGVRKTVAQMKAAGFSNVDSKLYPGMRHEILNETIKEEVFSDIYDWIFKRL